MLKIFIRISRNLKSAAFHFLVFIWLFRINKIINIKKIKIELLLPILMSIFSQWSWSLTMWLSKILLYKWGGPILWWPVMVLSLNIHSLEENKNNVRDRTVGREVRGLTAWISAETGYNPVRTDLFCYVVFPLNFVKVPVVGPLSRCERGRGEVTTLNPNMSFLFAEHLPFKTPPGWYVFPLITEKNLFSKMKVNWNRLWWWRVMDLLVSCLCKVSSSNGSKATTQWLTEPMGMIVRRSPSLFLITDLVICLIESL